LFVKEKTPSFKTANPNLEKKDLTPLIKESWETIDSKSVWEKKHKGLLEEWKTANELFMKMNPGWAKTPSKKKKVESGSLQLELVEGAEGGTDQVVM